MLALTFWDVQCLGIESDSKPDDDGERGRKFTVQSLFV